MCTANLIDILDVPFLELQEGFNLLKSKTFSKGTKLCQVYFYTYLHKYMGVSKNRETPQNGWWKSWKKNLFFNGWFGGEKPHYFRKHPFLYHFKSFSLTSPGKTSPSPFTPQQTWVGAAPTSSMTLNLKGFVACVKGQKEWMELLFNGVSWYILPIGWFFAYHLTKNNHWFIDLLFCEVYKGWHTYSFGQIPWKCVFGMFCMGWATDF